MATRVVRWTRRTTVPVPRQFGPPDLPPLEPRTPVPCRVYWIYVLDPRTNFTTLTLGYVGEVVDTPSRGPLVRFAEHVADQPWGDTIPETDPQRALETGILRISDNVYSCKEAVWAAEQVAIVHGRPLYNYTHNLTNPDRISIPDARAARAERDRLAGIPHELSWAMQFEQRQAARNGGQPIPAPAPVRVRRYVVVRQFVSRRLATRRGRRRAGYGVAWCALTTLLWVLAARYAPILSVPRLGGLAAGFAALLLLAINPPRRRGWSVSKLRYQLAVLAVTAAMILTVWSPLVDWLQTTR